MLELVGSGRESRPGEAVVAGLPSQGSCPDEEALLLFLARQVEPAAAEQIQAHLGGCPRCQLTAQALVTGGDLPPPSPRAPRTFGDGFLIAGRYWVLGLIGRGGMGEVYEVEDRLLPGPRMALKTLPSTHLDDPRALARFKAEVMLARRVSSPYVCRILEFGVHCEGRADAVPFLIMERLAGETLAARLARVGRLTEPQVRRLALQLIAGLQAVHAAGVIHRDFKPENVFLVPVADAEVDDGDGPDRERAVVLDFGLARSFDQPSGRGCSTGALVVGTPDYVAPEQVQGKTLGPAADVYSLGVVLFELFSGRRPFAGASPLEVATRRLECPAPALSSLMAIPRAWDRIVARCLARDPARRFPGMEALAAAIRARPEPRRRGRVVLALAAAVVLAGLAGVRTVGGRASPPPGSPAPPVIRVEAIRPAPVVLAPPPVTVPEPPVRAAAPARRPPRAPGGLALARARALFRQGRIDEACAHVERAREGAARSGPLYQLLGKCYMRSGRVEEAKTFYRRYLQLSPGAEDAPFVKGILSR